MTLGNKFSEMLGLVGNLFSYRDGEYSMSRPDRRRLAVDSIKVRLRETLKHRFKRPFEHARVLDYEIEFTDSGFFQQNLWEIFHEGEYFVNIETADPVIVDCGANIGLATLFFKRLFPASSVIAIEANPATFDVLKANVENNDLRNVQLMNLAVTDSDAETVELFTSDIAGDLRATTMEGFYHDDDLRPTTMVVPAGRLSRILPDKTDILKLDIEGGEMTVLPEIEDKLHTIENLILEFHTMPETNGWSLGRMLTFLENSGFKCVVKGATTDPVSTYANKPFANIIFATRH